MSFASADLYKSKGVRFSKNLSFFFYGKTRNKEHISLGGEDVLAKFMCPNHLHGLPCPDRKICLLDFYDHLQVK